MFQLEANNVMSIDTKQTSDLTAPLDFTPAKTRRTRQALLHVIARWCQKFLLDRAMRRAERQLQSLNDRTLKDIGLSRSEISSALIEAHATCDSAPPATVPASD